VRKIYIVPNIVTTANMFCGFYSVILSIKGEYVSAAWLILLAGIFDALDGRVARLAKATSQFGVEYDSLSDLISFGFAPSILFYQWAMEGFGRLGWLAAFLYLACAALRLARFNCNTSVIPKSYFQGLPSPMAAGMIATFVIFHQETGWPSEDDALALVDRHRMALFLTFSIASLMVSTLRFPSFKELNWKSKASFGYLMIGVLVMILLAVRPEVTLFLGLSTYVGLSLIWNVWALTNKKERAKRKAVAFATASASGGRAPTDIQGH
jgi:CDP-diacylglycerol--serine O-phosphatidyltransferase